MSLLGFLKTIELKAKKAANKQEKDEKQRNKQARE